MTPAHVGLDAVGVKALPVADGPALGHLGRIQSLDRGPGVVAEALADVRFEAILETRAIVAGWNAHVVADMKRVVAVIASANLGRHALAVDATFGTHWSALFREGVSFVATGALADLRFCADLIITALRVANWSA